MSGVTFAPASGLPYYTPAEMQRLERIRAAEFFLLKASTGGERLPCRNHLRGPGLAPIYHEWMSLACLPQPFTAADARAFVTVAVNTRRDGRRLSPKEIFDLATRHPRTAREWGGLEGGEHDTLYAVLLSDAAEPISAAEAQRYADAIRLRGEWSFALQPLRLRQALIGG